MRLIDADLLMTNLGFMDTEEEREENVGQIITWEDVDRMQTAFDAEKSVWGGLWTSFRIFWTRTTKVISVWKILKQC